MSEKIKMEDGRLVVPDNPIVPYIEGDGTGPDITSAAMVVWNAAVDKAYGGRRSIEWKEVLAGEKAHRLTGEWLPAATLDACRDCLVSIKGPLTTPVGGGIRSMETIETYLNAGVDRVILGTAAVTDPDFLEQAVAKLRGEEHIEKPNASIDIKVSAFIPEKSVPDEKQRVEMYRKIATISSTEDVGEVEEEYIDRYGDIPESVDNLMQIALIKSYAQELYISNIAYRDDMIVFTIDKVMSTKAIVEVINNFKGKMMFSSGETSYLSYKCTDDIIKNIKIILQMLKKTVHEGDK